MMHFWIEERNALQIPGAWPISTRPLSRSGVQSVGGGGSDRDLLWVLMTRPEGGAGPGLSATGLMKKYKGRVKSSAARSGRPAVTLVARLSVEF